MKIARSDTGGFTLLELVAVILLLAIAAVPLTGLFGQAGRSTLQGERGQTAAQLAQEGAERVLGQRRQLGFASLVPGTRTETLTGAWAGYTRSTVISRPATPPPGCPAGALCDLVTVGVDRAGRRLAEITFVLVDY